MLKKHKAGRLSSIILIGEEMGNPQPLYALAGRFRAEPVRAIGHLAVMKRKVIDFAADQAPDVEDH